MVRRDERGGWWCSRPLVHNAFSMRNRHVWNGWVTVAGSALQYCVDPKMGLLSSHESDRRQHPAKVLGKPSSAEQPLKAWYDEAIQAKWLQPADIKAQYRHASVLKIGGSYSTSKATIIGSSLPSPISSASSISSSSARTLNTTKSMLKLWKWSEPWKSVLSVLMQTTRPR